MKIVIQCSGSKHCGGRLQTRSGEQVAFVANPDACAATGDGKFYASPDGFCGFGDLTWRAAVQRYNERGGNPNQLLKAADLYKPTVYSRLRKVFGEENVFILSAGWGLIRADYLIPEYDITFSKRARKPEPTNWRDFANAPRPLADFNHLNTAGVSPTEEIHFFVTPDYLALCYELTTEQSGMKFIHYKTRKLAPGSKLRQKRFEYVEFVGTARTNWQNLAASEFASRHE